MASGYALLTSKFETQIASELAGKRSTSDYQQPIIPLSPAGKFASLLRRRNQTCDSPETLQCPGRVDHIACDSSQRDRCMYAKAISRGSKLAVEHNAHPYFIVIVNTEDNLVPLLVVQSMGQGWDSPHGRHQAEET